jgi:speckle-type POZ protein
MSETSSSMSSTSEHIMSSRASSVSEDDNSIGELTMELLQFTWKIPNFKFKCDFGDFDGCVSPFFSLADDPGMKLQLFMCTTYYSYEDEEDDEEKFDWMEVQLLTNTATNDSTKHSCEYHIELAILDQNGEKFISKSLKAKLTKTNYPIFEKFIHHKVLYYLLTKLLQNNTLTVFCRIRKVKSETLPPKKFDNQQCLVRDLGSLLCEGNGADVNFSFPESRISAHKAILAARSPVFAAMFQHDMQENKANEVEITDISSTVFKKLLQFIYTGQCKLEDMAEELLFAADKYQIEGLKQMCENHLRVNLNVGNAVRLLILSDMHQSSILKEHAIYFINRNAAEVRKTSWWKELIASHLHLLEELYNEIIDS